MRAYGFMNVQFAQVLSDLILFHQRYIFLTPGFQPGLWVVRLLKSVQLEETETKKAFRTLSFLNSYTGVLLPSKEGP